MTSPELQLRSCSETLVRSYTVLELSSHNAEDPTILKYIFHARAPLTYNLLTANVRAITSPGEEINSSPRSVCSTATHSRRKK